MDAVLLAGGFGTRLRPLTYTRPKPLLPVAGRPMVEWALDRLPPQVTKVIVAVNWQAETLEAHFAASERALEFVVVREAEPLGTAGAVRNCAGEIASDRFFVLNADIISDMDLGAMLADHEATGAEATLSLKEVEPQDVVHYGVARLGDDPRRIVGFVEKPSTPQQAPSRLINAGAYLMDASVLDRIPAGRLVSMEKEVFPKILADGAVGRAGGLGGCAFDGYWIDVGDPDRLRAASQHLDASVWHGPEADIAPDAEIADCVAGTELVVGAGARVERSVLGDRVEVGEGAVVVDCVVGDGEVVRGAHIGERIWTQDVPAGYPQQQVGNALAGKA
jgi:mannose-1-phosphate guanylyltransferase